MPRERKVEKWADIVQQLKLDLSKPVNRVSAKQIKSITQEEPRLMAKMDTIESLPAVFRDNGLFLLPVSRSEYVIVKGDGYHELEPLPEQPIVHTTQFPFPKSASDIESEGVYLDYAHSSGLLEGVTGIPGLHLTVRGRRTTPRFSFDVGGNEITVNKAQIEIDGGYEGRERMVMVEAKVGIPSSFSKRQLYYPFRTFRDIEPVRNLFLCFEPDQNEYIIWEYDFDPSTSLEAIKLVGVNRYTIRLSKPISIKKLREVPTRRILVPQADSVDKLIEFPFRVSEGYDTSQKMAKVFGFVRRQSSYYRHAAQLLDLVRLDGNKYRLTEEGERHIRLPSHERTSHMCRLLLEFPIMHEVFIQISADPARVVTMEDIIDIIRKNSDLTGTTLRRRAQTIIAWFRWIRSNLGIVEVDAHGNIRLSRQLLQ